jgi:hypothetical protein
LLGTPTSLSHGIKREASVLLKDRILVDLANQGLKPYLLHLVVGARPLFLDSDSTWVKQFL